MKRGEFERNLRPDAPTAIDDRGLTLVCSWLGQPGRHGFGPDALRGWSTHP